MISIVVWYDRTLWYDLGHYTTHQQYGNNVFLDASQQTPLQRCNSHSSVSESCAPCSGFSPPPPEGSHEGGVASESGGPPEIGTMLHIRLLLKQTRFPHYWNQDEYEKRGGDNKPWDSCSSGLVFEAPRRLHMLHQRYVTVLHVGLRAYSFIWEKLPFHITVFHLLFHHIHNTSVSPSMINYYFSDDICVPRCLSALLIPTHCIMQFRHVLFLSGESFFFLQIRVSNIDHTDLKNHLGFFQCGWRWTLKLLQSSKLFILFLIMRLLFFNAFRSPLLTCSNVVSKQVHVSWEVLILLCSSYEEAHWTLTSAKLWPQWPASSSVTAIPFIWIYRSPK